MAYRCPIPGCGKVFSGSRGGMEHLDGIRTAEAHGTGTLRKSTLGTVPLGESGPARLVAHCNIALGTMKALRQTLEALARG